MACTNSAMIAFFFALDSFQILITSSLVRFSMTVVILDDGKAAADDAVDSSLELVIHPDASAPGVGVEVVLDSHDVDVAAVDQHTPCLGLYVAIGLPVGSDIVLVGRRSDPDGGDLSGAVAAAADGDDVLVVVCHIHGSAAAVGVVVLFLLGEIDIKAGGFGLSIDPQAR